MSDNIVLFTGGFDPIHSGHIDCINEAAQYGRVIIGLNSDAWLTRKKGKPFMPFNERKRILEQFKNVLTVIKFNDSDNSATDAIESILNMFPSSNVIFVNGGDRTKSNILELIKFGGHPRVDFKFGIGGDNKKNSSSWILSDWKHPTEQRSWGKSMTYHESANSKIKRLVLDPGQSISMQYHTQRSEFWFVEEGICEVYSVKDDKELLLGQFKKHESIFVNKSQWHQLKNTGTDPLCIIEIQYGQLCSEQDIVRR